MLKNVIFMQVKAFNFRERTLCRELKINHQSCYSNTRLLTPSSKRLRKDQNKNHKLILLWNEHCNLNKLLLFFVGDLVGGLFQKS